MNLKTHLQALRHHLFVGVTLLGCVAPWVTPRHFPVHTVPLKTLYEIDLESQETTYRDASVRVEIVQNAC